MDYKQVLPERPGHIENYKKFSVALVLQELDGKDYIVLEQRSANLNAQPCEISFPGGSIEEGESDKEAAIRETCEELLIDPQDLDYYGQLDSLITSYGIELSVFLMRLNKDRPLERWNGDEVEKVLYFPVSDLKKEAPIHQVETHHKFPEDFPFEYIQGGRNYPFKSLKQNFYFYHIEGVWVWGLTARILYYFGEKLKDLES